jgi:rRNA maturation endonuclease Nob1
MKKPNKDKKKKTKIMKLNTKDERRTNYACSECFSFVDEEDKFCWNCGAEFDTEDIAYGSEDLKTESDSK